MSFPWFQCTYIFQLDHKLASTFAGKYYSIHISSRWVAFSISILGIQYIFADTLSSSLPCSLDPVTHSSSCNYYFLYIFLQLVHQVSSIINQYCLASYLSSFYKVVLQRSYYSWVGFSVMLLSSTSHYFTSLACNVSVTFVLGSMLHSTSIGTTILHPARHSSADKCYSSKTSA